MTSTAKVLSWISELLRSSKNLLPLKSLPAANEVEPFPIERDDLAAAKEHDWLAFSTDIAYVWYCCRCSLKIKFQYDWPPGTDMIVEDRVLMANQHSGVGMRRVSQICEAGQRRCKTDTD